MGENEVKVEKMRIVACGQEKLGSLSVKIETKDR